MLDRFIDDRLLQSLVAILNRASSEDFAALIDGLEQAQRDRLINAGIADDLKRLDTSTKQSVRVWQGRA